jgi:hypothetical protein
VVGCFDISYCVDDKNDRKESGGGDATKDLGNTKLAHHHVLDFSGCPTTHTRQAHAWKHAHYPCDTHPTEPLSRESECLARKIREGLYDSCQHHLVTLAVMLLD